MDTDSANRLILLSMMWRYVSKAVLLIGLVMTALSCNRDGVITRPLPPKILLDVPSGIYSVKVGRTLLIQPAYESVQEADYRWISGGELLGTDPSLSYVGECVGSFYVTLQVSTVHGTDEQEIRIDVLELEVPTVSLAGAEGGFTLAVGSQLLLQPVVKETSLPVSFVWRLDGSTVSREKDYQFEAEQTGTYELEFEAANEDGADGVSFQIRVLRTEDMPLSWSFDRTEYHYASGRKIRIAPSFVSHTEGVTYTWTLAQDTLQNGSDPAWICAMEQEGTFDVRVTATLEQEASRYQLHQDLQVTVCPPEGTYYRPSNASSSADWTCVFEYTPAPGQFINETRTGGFTGAETTPEAAAAYAQARLAEGIWVSLGGFGGYIVLGFDHSIDNTGEDDFVVLGNAFEGSSEPGVVWVMQDENGDGLPNDNWYELQGSESGKSTTEQQYAVTYFRPQGAGMPVLWQDNRGGSGQIDYLAQFHNQDSYYPLWIDQDQYTLYGTCLEARNYDESGNGTYWVQPAYDWGYADNFGNSSFRISHALDYEGNPIQLSYIDFIKVQTGVNAKSGWLGELSTEITGCYDLHP